MATSGSSPPPYMQAAQLCQFNDAYQLNTVLTPSLRDNEILVKIHAAGFCHSDLQVIQGEFSSKLPIVPSHEPAGIIVQKGSACDSTFQVGDRVGVLNFKNACGGCTGCRLAKSRNEPCQQTALDPRWCDHREMAGFKHDGAFAEYMVADPSTTVRLPDELAFEQAAPLMCAGATVWGALEKATAGLLPGDTVAIVGIGGLGHLGVQFAKALGFRTIAIDSREAGRRLASDVPSEALNPDLIVDSLAPDATQEIFKFTDGEGIAAAVVCTDSLPANEWAPSLLRIQGTLVLLGLPREKWRFDASAIVFKELMLRGSYVTSRESTERMMEVVEKHGIRSFLTVVEFHDVAKVVDMYKDKTFSGRIVVKIAS
ncbi:alcohol dehydrogenase GroES-like domain-containing protein [Microdochium trichocladiopsis]|uniref:Alcohol dehydrogenase GroES-like domain-containing protein n=1 Tax=Microdochium trichocladiopsis TaxID=1682393 RepID=A0A9P9BSR0_9PEZI|nr:alcohol dehydrogenase GroES-like domain-containing protein [Microdochium trichocladiopsis]KAH7034712.1 alcohol dehydrogenase GroES-like domain-containing protein [Microdochium trichocladiopsis]